MSQASVERTISKSSTKQRQTKSSNSTLETNEGGFEFQTLCIRLMLDKLLVMYVVDKKHNLFLCFCVCFLFFFFLSMNESA